MLERPDRCFEPLWEQQRRARRRSIMLPWLIWAAIIVAAIGVVLYASSAKAQAYFDCEQLASGIGDMAVLRDLGADREKVIAAMRKGNASSTPAHLAAIEREIRRVWQERLTPEDAKSRVFNRCRAQGGDMGAES